MTKTTRKHICSHVARLLREERLQRNLSLTVLAERAGLSQQSVSYVEREMRIPNLDTLLRIASALDLDLSEVIAKATKAPLSKNKS